MKRTILLDLIILNLIQILLTCVTIMLLASCSPPTEEVHSQKIQKKDNMSKFYSPRDYDMTGFGNNRRYTLISDEEKRKRAGTGTSKKENYEHFNKNWDKDLWD